MSKRLPETGQWYRHLDKGQEFCVIAGDEANMVVLVQSFDGDTEEFTFSEWRELAVEPCAQPENWAGALDIAELDDLGTQISDTSTADWLAPANEIHYPEDAQRIAQEDEPMNSDENDDYGEGYMKEVLNKAEGGAGAATYAKPDDVVRSEHGIISEVFSHDWRVEYTEDPKTGLWHAELFKHDVSQWVEIDQVSLACARECARNFYDQQ